MRRVFSEAEPVTRESLKATWSQTAAARDANNVGNSRQPSTFLSTESPVDGRVHVPPHLLSDNDKSTYDQPLRTLSSKLNDEERQSALDAELLKWKKRRAYTPADSASVPRDANIIGSHVIYKRKIDGTANGRIVPWGHPDQDKDYLRGDAPSASPEILRLILSLATEYGWSVGRMDMETAFFQALVFDREIDVRPPRNVNASRTFCKLERAAYGLADSGRLWYLTSDGEIVKNFGSTISELDYTLYFSHSEIGQLDFILAVQVDDCVYTGKTSEIDAFQHFLSSRFDVGNFERGDLTVMGGHIKQHADEKVTLSQEEMLAKLDPRILLDADGPKGDN